jgi:hypothetical protein
VKASGLGRSGAPDEVLQDFVGDPTAVLVYPSDRNEPVRMVETTSLSSPMGSYVMEKHVELWSLYRQVDLDVSAV